MHVQVLPPAAGIYQQRFNEFGDATTDDAVESVLIAAVNYVPRLQLSLMNGPIAENISPPEQWASTPSADADQDDDNGALNDLDRLFGFMEETIVELGGVYRNFLAGNAEVHPYLMQLLTNYILAVEESYVLLQWENPSDTAATELQACYDGSRHHMTDLLAGLARFPLERRLGHLPPASPAVLKAQFEALMQFHNAWADLVDSLGQAPQV